MAKTLQQILGAKNLTGVIQGVKDELNEGWLPGSFLKPTRTVEGNTCTYLRVAGTRQTARLVHYGSPSLRRTLAGVTDVPVTLLHTLEHVYHEAAVLMNLLEVGNEGRQEMGIGEVTRQTRAFKQLFGNLRLGAALSVLATGAIHFDAEGNLLPSASGAAVTVDMGVPEANTGTLDGVIGASWAVQSTAIHQQVAALKEKAAQTAGYPLRHAFYGANVLDYFLKNTYLKELINRNDGFQAAAAGGEIPQGVLGLQWHPVYEAFYEDQDGVSRSFFGDDQVVFTPEPSPEWWELIEGTYAVPTGQVVTADATAAAASLTPAAGMFSYALVENDPTAIKHIAGDTFLPVLKAPGAIYIADVTG